MSLQLQNHQLSRIVLPCDLLRRMSKNNKATPKFGSFLTMQSSQILPLLPLGGCSITSLPSAAASVNNCNPWNYLLEN